MFLKEHVDFLTTFCDQVYSNTRVPTSQHESTRINTSLTRVSTNQHESDMSQHESTRF